MASDPPKQVFNIKDLSTTSVTLYPTRAHVTRDIRDINLKPGANEIEIYGLSPSVDEHSIQIEGKGVASIVDMTVELVPNHDIFEEEYPVDSEDSEDDTEDESSTSDDEEDTVRELSEQIKDLQLQVAEANEKQNSATERLAFLDKYAKTVTAEHNGPDDITKLLSKYEEDRATIFKAHTAAAQSVKALNKEIQKKEKEKSKAGEAARKQKEKQQKQKDKERRKKYLQKAEKDKAAAHLKSERMRYWPRKVYKVIVLLEVPSSLDTPSSSRRNSIDSITLAQSPPLKAIKEPGKEDSSSTDATVSLTLSYVTREAGWSPRYDVKLSSVQNSATIVYRTEFLNRTSETWKDTKLSFSTSQTSYQGLDDAVPFMHTWRLKLSKYEQPEGGLLSLEERQQPRAGRPALDKFNRRDLFELDDSYIPPLQQARYAAPQQHSHHLASTMMQQQQQQQQLHQQATSSMPLMFGQAAPASAMMAATGRRGIAPQSVSEEVERERSSARRHGLRLAESEEYFEPYEPAPFEEAETTWEDSGLTTTYDVPGVRTLAPSSTTRRHRIASLTASNIKLNHICVPKLRSAAFLRAKIRNPSSTVTLLKGSAGVTLDGSFLGNMTLPRVSPGQVFGLPLGVDPAIHVNYPKPLIHRSTQGMIFNKESSQVYNRSIWINNTKSAPVEILVIDQVPVSEDERLRIVVTTPKGLVKEGDAVKAGVSAKEGSSGAVSVAKSSAWGNAVAILKKNGEVNWHVKLEKAQGCLLKLDYEARLPPSESIVPA